MFEKLRTARTLLEVAIYTKGEARKTSDHLSRMRVGVDEGLDITEALGNAVKGEFGVADSLTLGISTFNWAPKFRPELRRKKPWSWREG